MAPVEPSSSNSESILDCSSNTILVAHVSPFNSQNTLIYEKKYFSSGNGNKTTTNYYVENLKNNQPIYNPLNQDQEDDYKQLDPLLSNEQSRSVQILMDPQDEKPSKDAQESIRLPPTEFQKVNLSPMRFATQVSCDIYTLQFMISYDLYDSWFWDIT